MPSINVARQNSTNLDLFQEDRTIGGAVVPIHDGPLSGERCVPGGAASSSFGGGYRVVMYGRGFGKLGQPGELSQLKPNDSTEIVVDHSREIATILASRRPQFLPAVSAEELQADLARARQSGVLAERNRLAGEIHDGLAQIFTVICMQLGVAKEKLSSNEVDSLCSIQRAIELANFGLAEARHFAHKLRLRDQSGLAVALQMLVERTSVPGRLRCDFRSDNIPKKGLPPRVQHGLLRIAQEAIHNAVRHANPSVVSVALQWETPNLILQVKDNGSGISSARLEKSEGFGLGNMRERASEIDGRLEIQTDAGHGTAIIVTVPIHVSDRHKEGVDPCLALRTEQPEWVSADRAA
jgi:signal transduction histidine kinase